MGLDMYLYRREYVGGWDWKSVKDDGKERAFYDTILEYANLPRCEASPHANVEVCVAYWRKANAVHNWFVENVQDGVDECKRHHVEVETLRRLVDICKEVLADHSKADDLLPTQEGFFFGSNEIDDGYWEDLRLTLVIIDRALSLADQWDFEYHSSW